MSNNCHRPAGFAGVPVLDSAESFSKTGSIPWRHRELVLSWDQQLRGVIKQPPALDLSLFGCFRQSILTLSWLVTILHWGTFCCLLELLSGRQFSSVCLLLCDSTSGLFLRFWPLGESFLLLWLGSWGQIFDWLCPRLRDTHVSLVVSRLLWCSTSENRVGDVWMEISIILLVLGLAECSLTKVLSCWRVSSIKLCSLFWSSLRQSRLFFSFCRFEPNSAVASPL